MAESNGNDVAVSLDLKNGEQTKVVTDLDKKIIRQIEYYFGDINLPRDKFLQEQIKLEEGWIPLDIMLKFKRLSALSSDPEQIVNSLEKSEAKLMEVSEDRKKIRRSSSNPLPILNEDRRKELMSRTVYAKGFPVEGTTLDDLLTFFGTFGPVENVFLRNLKDKATSSAIFKGSAYATFTTVELAKAFLELESVKYKDTELVKQWQADHLEAKKLERQSRDDKKSPKKEGVAVTAVEAVAAKGFLLHMKGFGSEATREEIKKELKDIGAETDFVHFSKGDAEGWVRLNKENTAKEVLEKMPEGKLTIAGEEVVARLVEGEEEDTFLIKSREEMKLKRASKSGRGRGRGRGKGSFRGGNRGGRRGDKRRGSPTRGEGSNPKKQAV